MKYDLESIGPDRFQELCQSLLLSEYPRLLCLPVSQKDGGRDALLFLPRESEAERFVVFQVKFSATPTRVTDPHRWLMKQVKGEQHKIKRLLTRGAKEYVLLTNVPGTAAMGAGSIDKVAAELDSVVGIPSRVLWRDDIERRLDTTPDLRWAYPDLLRAGDLLRALLQSQLNESSQRRSATLSAYLADEFSNDLQVRFKQVELQNDLFSLFIDVPLFIQPPSEVIESRKRVRRGRNASVWYEESGRGYSVPATRALLADAWPAHVSRIILEGAPGQGKSTITQYIAQVHRARLLNRDAALSLVPEELRRGPTQFPFRLDLRDLASWIDGQDPFGGEYSPPAAARSLASFLAAAISYRAGGAGFSVDDLHATVRSSRVLLICDGLDEVASLDQRKAVVEEIDSGVRRLEEIALRMRVIITSRPVAFANTPGLPEDRYATWVLGDIDRGLAVEYSARWAKAKGLGKRESQNTARLLETKLDEPHVRDLARNAMQLAILLSLVHTRGASLPDKRTSLYDAYIDLFLNRESEKSSTVRDHRELIVQLHGYLGWVLHGEAERSRSAGRLSEGELKGSLKRYLESSGYSTSLVDLLFQGMVERVVAVVSRVQGTFEFEVQPLREYFAAKYLYDTAPYAPAGASKPGTLPERFAAIARNAYWLNVARFYAGYYNRGELSSLADGLEELMDDPELSLTLHPQALGLTLLADSVFAQHPKSVTRVIRTVLGGLGLRQFLGLGGRRSFRERELPVLPANGGRAQLLDAAITALQTASQVEYRRLLCEMVVLNSGATERMQRWMEMRPESSQDTRAMRSWLQDGIWLETLPLLSPGEVRGIAREAPRVATWTPLLRGGHYDVIESDAELLEQVCRGLMDTDYRALPRGRRNSWLALFLDAVLHWLGDVWHCSGTPVPYDTDLASVFGTKSLRERAAELTVPGVESDWLSQLTQRLVSAMERPTVEWQTTLQPWLEAENALSSFYGDTWQVRRLAICASAIRSIQVRGAIGAGLLDQSVPLVERARYARLRAGDADFWAGAIEAASLDNTSALDRAWILGLLVIWASRTALRRNIEALNDCVTRLDEESYRFLEAASYEMSIRDRAGRAQHIAPADLGRDMSARTRQLLLRRMEPEHRQDFADELRRRPGQWDRCELGVLARYCSSALVFSEESWANDLRLVRHVYAAVGYFAWGAPRHDESAHRLKSAPQACLREVLREPDVFPPELVRQAELEQRTRVAARLRPVAVVAEEQRWFDDV